MQDQQKSDSKLKDIHIGWMIVGFLALAAIWNQMNPDPKPVKTGNVEFDKCMERLSYGDEATSRTLCLQEATGTLPKTECHVEWDGRSNPTVCE